ncbi:MAG: DUF4139 domain-containing protein [Bacteroidota bacterium]
MKRVYVALILGLQTLVLCAQPTFKTKSVSIFKNGTAFFRKSAEFDASKGEVLLTDLSIATPDKHLKPNPLPVARFPHQGGSYRLYDFHHSRLDAQLNEVQFGSLWFFSPGNPLKSVSRYIAPTEVEQAVPDIPAMLRENPNLPVELRLKGHEDLVKSKTWEVHGDFIMLQQGQTWMTARLDEVEQVTFEGKPDMARTITEDRKMMRLDFEKQKAKQEVELFYMQKGLHWVPNYLVSLKENGKAHVKLRATVMNDIEDFDAAEVNFVVGVPTFKYSQVTSPLTSTATVAQFMNGLLHGGRHQGGGLGGNLGQVALSNSITTQNMINFAVQDATATGAFAVDQDAGLTNDLFFYKSADLSLRKGGRAYVDLLETTTECTRLHACSLPMNSGYRGHPQRKNEVWSSLRILNTSGKPFTTGAAFVTMQEGGSPVPIGQEQLAFTPAGMHAYLKTGEAVEVTVHDEDEDITGAHSWPKGWRRHNYEGRIHVVNFKKEAVQLEIRRDIKGHLKTSSVGWEKKERLQRYDNRNPLNEVVWKLNLKPGEKQVITYRYDMFVKH